MVVFALMALVLGLGILLTLKGNPWVLIAGVAGYAILLGTLGCCRRNLALNPRQLGVRLAIRRP
jgi:hypothetical protein